MRTIQFIIGRLEYVGSNKFLAGGRSCLDELRQGDRLQIAPVCGDRPVEVTVNQMAMYDHNVTEVSSGLSAGLIFDNEIAQHFRLGTELKAEIT